ncbi:HAMP domain-containing sensor histidine kinase [soil metagenome]
MNQQIRQLRLSIRPYIPTLRLAASYLAVIMVMSLGFSAIIYNTSAREIGRQLPPTSLYGQIGDNEQGVFDDFFKQRITNGQHKLFTQLVVINTLVLISGAAVSYVLARRSLEPIEEAMEAQSRFASDASHELRTPLASIQAENEVALRNPKLTLTRSKQILASNLEEVTRLQALSAGLLRLAREDGRDITLSPVSLADAVSEAITNYHKPATQKHIGIVDKVSRASVLADQPGLTQVLSILLDNAIKYSPPKTTITITGGARGKDGYITVSDEGPGIGAEDLPHIFDRFYRADASRTSQQVSGHGLGLALAQKIVEQSGGAIEVKSKPGKGAKFTVRFPLA